MRTDTTRAVPFNGSSPYFSDAVLTPVTDNFGIEAWVKPGTLSGTHVIVDNGNGSSTGWAIREFNGTYQAELSGILRFGTGAVTLNGWTHLALVRDSGTASLHVNGVAAGTDKGTPAR